MKNRDLITLVMICVICGTLEVHSAEPDEGGIGGTGHIESESSTPLFDRPELPERVETPERVEVPTFPDTAAPAAGEVVTQPTPPEPVSNPTPGR